jgi:elongation factor G
MNGVEVGTELTWENIEEYQTPAIFVINQLDHDKANFDQSLDQLKMRFGNKVLPLQYPLNTGAQFNTIVDALRMIMYVFSDDGGKPQKVDIPDSEIQRAQEMHNVLVEAAAENDEALMEKFFDEGSLTEEELTAGLKLALAKKEFYPVFCVSAEKNIGSGRLMGFINDISPAPDDRSAMPLEGGGELKCSTSDGATVFIYKTMSEPQVGNVSYFKICSGVLNVGDELVNQQNNSTERMNQLFESNGKNRNGVNQFRAGDLGVTVKLKNSHTNNTLSVKGKDRIVDPIHFPAPRIRAAIKPPSKAELEKLARALQGLHEEDPTLIIEHSPELRQMLLHGQGQLHLDITKYRIEKVHGISMEYIKPRIPYRETITREATEIYRHKKQTGGAGQFAEVHMRIEPYFEGMPDPHGLNVRNRDYEELEAGGKLAFYWCVVGGAIDTRFSSAIKKGVMSKMMEGPLTGSYCRDIRVCVFDGKMHAVDSNDMAFQIAGSYAFRNGFQKAAPQLLEPIYDLEILCASEVMGDVMGDLQTRRAIIMGMAAEGHYQKILVRVPLAELYQYSSTLRSLTQGKAKFNRKFAEYAPVPGDIQQRLIAEYEAEYQEA